MQAQRILYDPLALRPPPSSLLLYYWLLTTDYWLLATDYWLLATGYQVLFLDVLFPLKVKRVIYIDSDQLVRAVR